MLTTEPPNYLNIWSQVENLPWCALVTTGRTGTDFLQSLLDSHPEAFVFNGQLYFHDFWKSSYTVNIDGERDAADIVNEFIGTHIKHLKSRYDSVERKDELGEGRNSSIDIDIDIFRTHVLKLLAGRKLTSKNCIIAVYVSYALCLGQDIGRKKIFFHHQHRISRLGPFLEDFPVSKVICMTRDPRANYVSGVEHWRRFEAKTDNPSYPLYILKRAIDEQLDLLACDADTVRILRLEDLGSEYTLNEICRWIEISYDSCMTRSTWAGMRWWGDRLSTSKIAENERGFSSSIIQNNWIQKLSVIDRMLLDYLLADMLDAYSYDFERKSGIVPAVFVLLAILLPTTYERRYLSPGYLFRALAERNLRKFIVPFYHPFRRSLWFYRLFYRRIFGTLKAFPVIGVNNAR
jgi:hypothetical protein